MRIVIDLQGAQTESRFRGIGRYSLSLTQAMVRNRGNDEIILALSGLFPETIEPLRAAFQDLLPQDMIRVWHAPGPVAECNPDNNLRRAAAEGIREAFLLSLQPDVIVITSLFEGLGDDAVTSAGLFDQRTPVAVILYDLIPLLSPDIHFRTNPIHKNYYHRKMESLKRSACLLAISESSRQEALETGLFAEHQAVTISGASEDWFRVLELNQDEKTAIGRRFGVSEKFIMYTGGADERKNLPRLIRAYAALPLSLRQSYQLLMVGKMPVHEVRKLEEIAHRQGLGKDAVLFTGYVENEDLVQLYNTCSLFIFPSLHEGLGLPPLEAMACGAPVIAARATSLPEIVGCDEALFDPQSEQEITEKLTQVLSDDDFRSALIEHGFKQVRKFTWDNSAVRALQALQVFNVPAPEVDNHIQVEKTTIFQKQRIKILVLKLDHMGDFVLAIPAMTKLRARYPYARFDVVVGSWNEQFAKTLNIFDNIYTFDFFKKKSALTPSAAASKVEALVRELGHYDLALDFRRQSDSRFILAKVMADCKVGYETFDAAVDEAIHICLPAYRDEAFEKTRLNKTSNAVQILQLVNALPENVNDYIALPDLTAPQQHNTIEVAIFPAAGNDVKEWGGSKFAALVKALGDETDIGGIHLYFGDQAEKDRLAIPPGPKVQFHIGLDLTALLQSLAGQDICIANNSFGAHIASYLGLVVVGVYSGHEIVAEWAPTFANSYVIHSGADCSPCHIASRSQCERQLSCMNNISVDFVWEKVHEAINSIKSGQKDSLQIREKINPKREDEIIDDLTDWLSALEGIADDTGLQQELAHCIAASIPPANRKRQLLLDVSTLIHVDGKSGIQRVVKSLLKQFYLHPPGDYEIAAVYAHHDKPGYLYAREFARTFCGKQDQEELRDEPISFYAGDIFLGLDLAPHIVPHQREFYQRLRQQGVNVQFVVYDILSLTLPQYFDEGPAKAFQQWLEAVAENDGAICISQAVAAELRQWLEANGPQRQRPFHISWFHLGADIANSYPSRGLPADSGVMLATMRQNTSFLMVGTVEPRKGHKQTLSAFEELWKKGLPVNLVIVGKQGWKMGDFVDRLRRHEELGKRLFWLESISDEYLEKIYGEAHCLLAASEGEGFGLPLIEAAQHNMPIIARDLPVFQEVAGSHAFYFNGLGPNDLANAIVEWLQLFEQGQHPQAAHMPYLLWEQSANQLLDVLRQDDCGELGQEK